MKFLRIAAAGFGFFTAPFAVDLSDVAGPLVAVTGENGAGKSTLLELLVAGLYRECPTRGTLVSLATSREAWLEVDVLVGDRSYRLRHAVDAISRKSEATVIDLDTGEPLVTSGKVRDFDAWVAKHLPAPEVVYASVFSAQASGGFLALPASERKRVLLRVLGVEHVERCAEVARERLRTAKAALQLAETRLADERARAGSVEGVTELLDATRAEAADAEAELERALAALTDAQEARRAAVAAQERVHLRATARDLLVDQLVRADEMRSGIAQRIANNEGLLARGDVIRAAQADAVRLEAELAALVASTEAARRGRDAAERDFTAATGRSGRALKRCEAARARKIVLRPRLEARPAIDAAAAALPGLREASATALAAVEAAASHVHTLRSGHVAGLGERVDGLRGGLNAIAYDCKTPSHMAETASNTLTLDDVAGRAANEAPVRLAAAGSAWADARAAHAKALASERDAEQRASRGSALDAMAAELAQLEEADEEADAEAQREQAVARAALSERMRLDALLAEPHHDVGAALAAAREASKHVGKLAEADARLEELRPQLAALDASIAQLEAERAAIVVPEAPPVPDTRDAETRHAMATSRARQVHADVARAEAALAQATEGAQRAEVLAASVLAAQEAQATATLVADTLGSDGLQAYEIDAAGPELSRLATDLLHEAHGPRWTVAIETTRLAGDGKREIEDLVVRVIDCERGTDGPADRLSGGEKVCVGEAVSLALAALAGRRAGLAGMTLVRDESGAALDPGNARSHVAMLRRAMEIVGAEQCLLVTHSADVAALCDSRLVVGGGVVCPA
jgi:DNA repair exonuclease SbcCD ATPase subunit